MIEKWCELNGVWIRLHAADESLLAPILDGWSLSEAASIGSPDFALTLLHGTVAEASGTEPLLFDGIMPDGQHCVIRKIGSQEHYAIDSRASLLLGKRDGLMTIAPGNEALACSNVGFQAINAALALNDQSYLHAAALVLPQGNAAILIFGASGSGKTTTTLSLCRQDFVCSPMMRASTCPTLMEIASGV